MGSVPPWGLHLTFITSAKVPSPNNHILRSQGLGFNTGIWGNTIQAITCVFFPGRDMGGQLSPAEGLRAHPGET